VLHLTLRPDLDHRNGAPAKLSKRSLLAIFKMPFHLMLHGCVACADFLDRMICVSGFQAKEVRANLKVS
jgi:hypothetical protein